MTSTSILHWSYWHAALMLPGLLAVWYFDRPEILPVLAGTSLLWYAWTERSSFAHLWRCIGRANLLSLVRFISLALVVMLFPLIPTLLLAAILIPCVILDGYDGKLARLYHESSEFGHYLDVEIDAFGIACLSVLLWHHAGIGVWVMFMGALRYGYVWLIRLTVTTEKLEPKRRYASVIAVIVYVVMTARLVFDHVAVGWILVVSCLLLVASFTRSAAYQWMGD